MIGNPKMRIIAIDSSPFHQLSYTIGSSTPAMLPFFRGSVDSMPDGLGAIVATGDLQGVVHLESSARSPILLGEALAAEMQLLQCGVKLPPKEKLAIVLTGDLQPSAGMDDVLGVWEALAETSRWVAGVAGNHDAFAAENASGLPSFRRPRLHFFDDRIEQIGSLRIGGISGIIGNTREPWGRSDTEFTAGIERLSREAPDLLLMHDGPNVAGTMLAGWPGVRQVLEAAKPCIVFRGHDAWPTLFATLCNGTQVVNVEGRVMVLTRDAAHCDLGGERADGTVIQRPS